MAQERNDPEDKDLDWELAVVEELKTCSVDSSGVFHLIRFLKRAAVKKHHDELIATVKYYLPFNEGTDLAELLNEAMASLERKKREAEEAAAQREARRMADESFFNDAQPS